MRKILLLIALIAPNTLWAVGADSTRSSLHVEKRGDSILVRSTARIVVEDSVTIGNPRAPTKAGGRVDSLYTKHLNFTTVTVQSGTGTAAAGLDSLQLIDSGISGGDLAGTLSGDKIWTGTTTHLGTQVLTSLDSLYQAWPYTVVIDSAGNGHRTTIGTVSISNASVVVRQGSYAGATISGSKNIIRVVGRITLTDSLLITGNDNYINLGPGASIGGTRISGDRNKLQFENGLNAGSLATVAGADDNTVDGGGWGSVFKGGNVIGGKRTVLQNVGFVTTINDHNLVFSAGSDSSVVTNCRLVATSTASEYTALLIQSHYPHISNNQLYAPISTNGGGIYMANDFGLFVGNDVRSGVRFIAGADSSVFTGNNLRGAVTNNGTGNIVSGGIP